MFARVGMGLSRWKKEANYKCAQKLRMEKGELEAGALDGLV